MYKESRKWYNIGEKQKLETCNMRNGQLSIVMLCHKRIPSREGGVEVAVQELATRMVENGNDRDEVILVKSL